MHPQHPELCLLRPDRLYSWFRRVVLREASAGLMLRVPELRVVAYGAAFDLPGMGGAPDPAVAAEGMLAADPDPALLKCRHAFALPWGRTVNLFFHADQWLVFTDQSPDASELLVGAFLPPLM